ncbi:hypothetical protein [uncultured Thiothrix sp.]|uniref:hypothetical protein n=1 Tax=uncultured Thiothrix sp. TaxID=223185 RepID=UPI002626F037|nr:hypothetical protein [uncultured Thiothrix sp.]
MTAITLQAIKCPLCTHTFDYPTPLEIPDDVSEIIKETTCPICERRLKIRFEVDREVSVYRGSKTAEKRVFKRSGLILAEQGD